MFYEEPIKDPLDTFAVIDAAGKCDVAALPVDDGMRGCHMVILQHVFMYNGLVSSNPMHASMYAQQV